MRTLAAAAVVGMAGSLLSPAVAPAAAAPSCAAAPLGAAGAYGEFIEGDSTRYADAEGAVAVGGDAKFGDSRTGQGFSVGDKLATADLDKLAGKRSLVVAGNLSANQVVISKGSGVYGKLTDQNSGAFAVDGAHSAGASPIDFGKEFKQLRTSSKYWAAMTPTGKAAFTSGETSMLLTGENKKTNVFTVDAADLQKARSIAVKVPAGSTTLINVLGTSYDMSAGSTYGVQIWDPQVGKYVLDDYTVGSDEFKGIRSRMLWNFPQASSILKNNASWPGTILAPDAHVSLGRTAGSAGPAVGPGHVNGSVIAKTLTTVPGAETHQMAFAGCLMADAGTTDPVIKPAPEPDVIATTLPAPVGTPTSPADPADPAKPSPSTSPESSSTSGTKPTPSPSDAAKDPAVERDFDGILAATGGGVPPVLVAGGFAALLGGAVLGGVAIRRRAGGR